MVRAENGGAGGAVRLEHTAGRGWRWLACKHGENRKEWSWGYIFPAIVLAYHEQGSGSHLHINWHSSVDL